MEPKKAKLTDKVGYVMLGVAVDYFLFKPARALKPLWTFGVGFVFALLLFIGVENLANFFTFLVDLAR